ncbi:MAG: hypothetical protein ACP5NN_02985 [Methanolinea sp.]
MPGGYSTKSLINPPHREEKRDARKGYGTMKEKKKAQPIGGTGTGRAIREI